MSWLARSLANSLAAASQNPKMKDEEEDEQSTSADHKSRGEGEEFDRNRGVKEDLSELSQTLTRQFLGIASFLAPPPPSISPDPNPTVSDMITSSSSSPRIGTAIRNDFAEIGGRFRSGISRLSNNLIQFRGSDENRGEEYDDEAGEEEEEEEESVIGVTPEVMAFARNIAMHAETWLDFPLFNEFEDTDDFEISDAQQEHAIAVESLLPRLAALRIELCPAHMSEGCFWKIYFVLLHSRLNKDDAKLLSTPQVDEARAMLLQKLQNKTKPDSELSLRGLPHRNVDVTSALPRGQVSSPSSSYSNLLEDPTSTPSVYLETEKIHLEVEIIDKPMIEKDPSAQPKGQGLGNNFSGISIHDYDDEYGDDWLEEDETGVSLRTTIPFGNEEDVSFSDLEDEDEPLKPLGSKSLSNGSKR